MGQGRSAMNLKTKSNPSTDIICNSTNFHVDRNILEILPVNPLPFIILQWKQVGNDGVNDCTGNYS